MKYNDRILFSLMFLLLSLSDQMLGELSDILRKYASQKFAFKTGVEREPMTNVLGLYKGN